MPKTVKQLVLDTLRSAESPLTMLEIARRCGKQKSSGFERVVRSLAADGLVYVYKPKASNNGRPAHLYELMSNRKKLGLRRQWELYCAEEIPLDYVTWLESVARGEIKLDDGV